jgi:sugar phosphate isomerase/epimerase
LEVPLSGHLISLAALTILDAGPVGQVRAAAKAGFTSVGLRLMPLLDTDTRAVGDAAAQTALELALDETGIEVLEIGVFPVKAEMDWKLIEDVVSFSGLIGARHLVCPVEDADMARRVETFQKLCDMAREEGLDALVEFNPYSACPALADALAILGKAGRENAGLVIDVLHLSRSGGKPEDLAKVDPMQLRLVHLCDALQPPNGERTIEELRVESRTARLLPGEGQLWLDRLLKVLPPEVPLSIEAPSALNAGLPAAERARRALAATQAFLMRNK